MGGLYIVDNIKLFISQELCITIFNFITFWYYFVNIRNTVASVSKLFYFSRIAG